MRRIAMLLLVLAALPARAAAPWNLDALMAELHAVPAAKAHFTEYQTSRLLTVPLQTAGTLSYTAPDQLEKHTTSPAPDSTILHGDQLSGVQSNGESFAISLSAHPEVGALVEGIRATMAGDLATLRRYYTVTLDGSRDGWHLALAPVDATVRGRVAAIRIDGAGAALAHVQVQETDGDTSVMTITPDAP